jgi:hypothetical protein
LEQGNNDQAMVKKTEEIVHGIQERLRERVAKYDDLVNKHMMLNNKLI